MGLVKVVSGIIRIRLKGRNSAMCPIMNRAPQAELAHSALQLGDRRGRILAWEGGEPRGYSRTTSAAKSLACLVVQMAAPASVIPGSPAQQSALPLRRDIRCPR
jgi:hypothetical protein